MYLCIVFNCKFIWKFILIVTIEKFAIIILVFIKENYLKNVELYLYFEIFIKHIIPICDSMFKSFFRFLFFLVFLKMK